MGGAHPNHYDGTSTFTFSSFPKELNMSNESNQTGWKDLRQSDWEDIAANGRNGSLPEDIKRELIIEGRHSIFIDRLDEEPDPIDMNDFKNVDLDEIKGDGMYEDVNVQELDAFMYREDGSLKIAVQAHTFASYAESGDYQFTAEAEAGLVSGKISAGNAEWADAEKWMKKAEKGVDAFKSPSGKLIFVWTNEELIAYAADGEKEVFRKKVPGMSSVIQAEWATGKFVAKWAEAGK